MKLATKYYTLLGLAAVLFLLNCASAGKKHSTVVLSAADFDFFSWREKVIYIHSATSLTPDKREAFISLLRYAFLQNQSEVMIAIADSIGALKLDELHDLLLIGVRNPYAIFRWHSLKALGEIEIVPADVSTVVSLIKDREWLVRETAFAMMRNYPQERIEKKYYYDILTSLNDSNESVLKQIYSTLSWYNDKRTFPYIYQRSFRANNQTELIFILRELAKYDSPTVRKRLIFLSQNHADAVVRSEARKLLY